MNDIRPDAVLKGVEVIEFPGPCSGKATPGRSASPLKKNNEVESIYAREKRKGITYFMISARMRLEGVA